MYAIIKTGGKQFRVKVDDVIDVELLKADLGATVEFEVLFIHDGSKAHFGKPKVEGFDVKGEVIGNSVGPKVESLKYKRTDHTQTRWGHRQHYTRVKIMQVGNAGSKKAAPKRKTKKAETQGE